MPRKTSADSALSASGTSGPAYATTAEVADRLQVSTRTIRRYIADGTLKAVRIGPRLVRVDVASVDALARPLGWAGDAA